MTKVVNSTKYSANSIFVGCSVNEDGEPLVEVNGKAIGTVAGLLDFLGKYQGEHKADVNVRWVATTDNEVERSLLEDTPGDLDAQPFVFRKGALHLDEVRVGGLDGLSGALSNVNIENACIHPLIVGEPNIDGLTISDQLSALKDRIESLETVCSLNFVSLESDLASMNVEFQRRVEEAIASAERRNVRRP